MILVRLSVPGRQTAEAVAVLLAHRHRRASRESFEVVREVVGVFAAGLDVDASSNVAG